MIVHKLFSTEKSQFQVKEPYKKPVYKSYRELLQLDKPKRKISFEEEEENDDFLEKLLSQEKQKMKEKKKKKKSRKSSGKSDNRPPGSQKLRVLSPNKQQNRLNPERMELKQIQQDINQIIELKDEVEEKEKKVFDVKVVKSRSSANLKNPSKTQSNSASKIANLEKDPIFIDNSSIDMPKTLFLATNQLLNPSLTAKKNQSVFNELLASKMNYLHLNCPKQTIDTFPTDRQIQHKIQHNLDPKYTFAPKIEPINPNWRFNLTIGPKNKQTNRKEFVDRKGLFHSQKQEDRFVKSLRELSSLKK